MPRALSFEFDRIDVSLIDTNPNNPRGKNVRERDPQYEYLKQSVGELGVLVPLIVRKNGRRYELIDGERRFHVARSLRLEKVPVYIVKGEIDEAEVQTVMFHIHMNRLQWKPAQELKASEPLYARLITEFSEGTPELLEAYIRETGMNARTARNRLQFLRWPRRLKEKIYEERQDDYWYVIEIEDKIIEPARKNYPEYFEKVEVDDVREFLFRKLEEGLVGAAVEVRDASLIPKSKTDGEDRAKVIGLLDRVVREPEFTFGQAREAFIDLFPEAAEPAPLGPVAALNAIYRLLATLEANDADYFIGQQYPKGVDRGELAEALSSLAEAIDSLIRGIED